MEHLVCCSCKFIQNNAHILIIFRVVIVKTWEIFFISIQRSSLFKVEILKSYRPVWTVVVDSPICFLLIHFFITGRYNLSRRSATRFFYPHRRGLYVQMEEGKFRLLIPFHPLFIDLNNVPWLVTKSQGSLFPR